MKYPNPWTVKSCADLSLYLSNISFNVFMVHIHRHTKAIKHIIQHFLVHIHRHTKAIIHNI